MLRFRLTVRRMMVGIGIVAIILSITVPLGQHIVWQQKRGELVRGLVSELEALKLRCPRSVSPAVWDEAMGWTINIGSDLYCNDEIPIRSRERLINDLRQRLRVPIGSEVIPWVWGEYAAIARGTSSEGFVRGHCCCAVTPLLRDALYVWPAGVDPDAWSRAREEIEAALNVLHGRHGGGNAPWTDEEERFVGSVAAILADVDWRRRPLAVWERIAQAGPEGKRYEDQHLASFLRVLEGAVGER